MKNKALKIISSLLFTVVLLASCSKNVCENSEKAEFKDLTGLDGCGYVIELSNGDRLEAINLGDFDIEVTDGKKIWVNYHLSSGMVSICMVGEIVEIDCISER